MFGSLVEDASLFHQYKSLCGCERYVVAKKGQMYPVTMRLCKDSFVQPEFIELVTGSC